MTDTAVEAGQVVDHWFARSSQGYSGKGTKATGYEHHLVRVDRGQLTVESEVAFKNFGVHRYNVRADQKQKASRFDYGGGEIVVSVSAGAAGWRGEASAGQDDEATFTPDASGTDGLLSLIGRFLPVVLPRETGELARYVPVPEDGFPWWRPGDGRSWFPLVSGWSPAAIRNGRTPLRTIWGRGVEQLKIGRMLHDAYRYDHVQPDGGVAATTWVDGLGVLRYAQPGTVLVRVTRDSAVALEPVES